MTVLIVGSLIVVGLVVLGFGLYALTTPSSKCPDCGSKIQEDEYPGVGGKIKTIRFCGSCETTFSDTSQPPSE